MSRLPYCEEYTPSTLDTHLIHILSLIPYNTSRSTRYTYASIIPAEASWTQEGCPCKRTKAFIGRHQLCLGWANLLTTARGVFYHDHDSILWLHRSAMYTRGIDSNLESGRYISRVGRTSRFLSLYLLRYLRYGTVGTYGTIPYSTGTVGTTVNTYQ